MFGSGPCDQVMKDKKDQSAKYLHQYCAWYLSCLMHLLVSSFVTFLEVVFFLILKTPFYIWRHAVQVPICAGDRHFVTLFSASD